MTVYVSELSTYLVRQVVWSRVRGVFLPVLGQFARLKALKNILRVSKCQDLNSRVLHNMYILQRFYQQYQDQTHLRVLPVTRNFGEG